MNHEAASQQREILRHRQAQPAQNQHQKEPGVSEMLDVIRNQPAQDLIPLIHCLCNVNRGEPPQWCGSKAGRDAAAMLKPTMHLSTATSR